MATSPTELSVRSESIQRLYDLYVNDRFRVNRRYQRKLVWTVEEKQRLIDSIAKDLPVPLFLVARCRTPMVHSSLLMVCSVSTPCSPS
jgi:hypothetical protein